MARKICTIILALAIAFFGFLSLCDASEPVEINPKSLSEVSYTALEKGDIYYVEDLILADSYAEKEDGSVLYFLTIFTDGNGSEVAITMPMNKDNDLWSDANAYLNDASMYIGDYTVDCYVKVENNYTSDNVLYDYFDEYVTDLNSQGYYVRSTSSLRLSYVCGPNEDPTAAAEGANSVGRVVGIVCIALAILMVVLALKGGKSKAAAKPQAAVQQTPVYQPTPQPSAPADDVMTKLKQYQNLRDSGFLTDEEYEAKRKQLLNL